MWERYRKSNGSGCDLYGLSHSSAFHNSRLYLYNQPLPLEGGEMIYGAGLSPEDTAKLVLWRRQHVELLSLKLSNNMIMRQSSVGHPVTVWDFSISLVWFGLKCSDWEDIGKPNRAISYFPRGLQNIFSWPAITLHHYNLHHCRLRVGEGFIYSKQANVMWWAVCYLAKHSSWQTVWVCQDKGGVWLMLIGSCGEQHLVKAEGAGQMQTQNLWI